MRQIILDFPKQFDYEPLVENPRLHKDYRQIVVSGMGGSHLAGDILQATTNLPITVHSDYGLPKITETAQTLIIASSFSGNTEEVLDSARVALAQSLDLVVITKGGKLLDFAETNKLPHIKLPEVNIEPRHALGYSLRALLKILGEDVLLESTRKLSSTLETGALEAAGKALAEKLTDFIPVIYASNKNHFLAYNWKIKLNETAKAPAFCNTFPELNHNELSGFADPEIAKKFFGLLIEDGTDDERIKKRVTATKEVLIKQGLQIESIKINSGTEFQNVFENLILADWTSLFLAEIGNKDPERVPLIEDFKTRIASDA